jgi:hypothetical protein
MGWMVRGVNALIIKATPILPVPTSKVGRALLSSAHDMLSDEILNTGPDTPRYREATEFHRIADLLLGGRYAEARARAKRANDEKESEQYKRKRQRMVDYAVGHGLAGDISAAIQKIRRGAKQAA